MIDKDTSSAHRVAAILAACDVSEQSAEAAMARLGLQFTAEEIQL